MALLEPLTAQPRFFLPFERLQHRTQLTHAGLMIGLLRPCLSTGVNPQPSVLRETEAMRRVTSEAITMRETQPWGGAGQTVLGVLEHQCLPESPSRNGKAYQMLQASIARGCAGAAALRGMGRALEGVSPQPHGPLDRALDFGFVCWSLILLCLETE